MTKATLQTLRRDANQKPKIIENEVWRAHTVIDRNAKTWGQEEIWVKTYEDPVKVFHDELKGERNGK